MEDTNYRTFGLARVSSGWASGSLQVTVGSASTTVPVEDVTSAIVVAIRTAEILRSLGMVTAQPYATEAGVLGWVCSSDFAYGASGTIKTRLGLTTTASGSDVRGTGAHHDGWYPSRGISINRPLLYTTASAPVADGSAVGRVLPKAGSVSLKAHAPLSEIWTLEDDLSEGSVWDMWAAGRWRGRIRVEDVRRVRLGRAATEAALEIRGTSYFDQVES